MPINIHGKNKKGNSGSDHSAGSTLSTPRDMVNADGEEEIFITATGTFNDTVDIPDQVYTLDKSKPFIFANEMETDDEDDDVSQSKIDFDNIGM